MIRYQYECDTCSENHFAEFTDTEEAKAWAECWEQAGLMFRRVN